MVNPRSSAKIVRDHLWVKFPSFGQAELSVRHSLLRRRLWDLAYIGLLPRSGGTAVDVGANIGIYSLALSRNHTIVNAFEPNSRLRRRLAAAAPANVIVWPVALSDTAGAANLTVPHGPTGEIGGKGTIERDAHFDQPASSESIQTCPLDLLALDNVSFLKIDVEGHEQAVLTGASSLLQKSPKLTILVEAEERHKSGAPKAVRAMLEPLGYRGFFVFEKEVRSVSEFNQAEHQAERNVDDLDRYSHMFVYTRDDTEEVVDRMRETQFRTDSRAN
jgi:FkbM family methyltransferase